MFIKKDSPIANLRILVSFFVVSILISCENETTIEPAKSMMDYKSSISIEPVHSVDPAYVVDIDGNFYHTVTIGNQIWMVENLKTTKYNDGTEIPLLSIDQGIIPPSDTPSYCWYMDDKSNKSTYGALYNWYVVNNGNLAPKGWHIPSMEEWTTLITYLNGWYKAGGELKEAGTSHWNYPNEGATNRSGFTGLPGGYCDRLLFYAQMKYVGYWWSTDCDDQGIVPSIGLWCYDPYVQYTGIPNDYYLSVRCILD